MGLNRDQIVKIARLTGCKDFIGNRKMRVFSIVACIADDSGVEGGRYFFSTVREGDQIMFATDDESERTLWIQAVYRATGQSHKPVLSTNQPQRTTNTHLSKVQGGLPRCNLSFTLPYGVCLLSFTRGRSFTT